MSHDAIRILAKEKPLVMLNRRVPDVRCVVSDIAGGMRRAVEHLVELGHESVTYVRLFVWMHHNAANRTEVFHLPPDRTIVMGAHLEL